MSNYQRGTDLGNCPGYCSYALYELGCCIPDGAACPRETTDAANKGIERLLTELCESVRIIEALVATIDDILDSSGGRGIIAQDYARLNDSLVDGRAYVRRHGKERTNG